jgi:fatty-acyl-CoA synthase
MSIPNAKLTIADWTERWARERPDAPAVLQDDRIVTWRELDAGANRYARWAKSLGLKKGDVVTILMENRPEYIMAWLGLLKSGVIAALVNTHLTGQPLAHSIALAGAKHLILGSELADTYAAALAGVESHPTLWGDRTDLRRMRKFGCRAHRPFRCAHAPRQPQRHLLRDKALYIYTSGTTGLPKAANISHMRLLHIMSAFQGAVNAGPDDRMYDVLPLYHSSGGIAALGPPFLGGGSVVLRGKFSATEFWEDCRRYRPRCSNISASYAAIC